MQFNFVDTLPHSKLSTIDHKTLPFPFSAYPTEEHALNHAVFFFLYQNGNAMSAIIPSTVDKLVVFIESPITTSLESCFLQRHHSQIPQLHYLNQLFLLLSECSNVYCVKLNRNSFHNPIMKRITVVLVWTELIINSFQTRKFIAPFAHLRAAED